MQTKNGAELQTRNQTVQLLTHKGINSIAYTSVFV